MNVNRLIIAVGWVTYLVTVITVWRDGVADQSGLFYVNAGYGIFLLVGSYVSAAIRRRISELMTVALVSVMTHALYLVWVSDVSPTLVVAVRTPILGVA